MAMRRPGVPRPKMPNRIHNPSAGGPGGMPSMGTHRKPVGYGLHGKPFYNIRKYHQSKSFALHQKHPGLSQKPVGYGAKGKAFFSKTKYAASKMGRLRNAAIKTTTKRRQRPR